MTVTRTHFIALIILLGLAAIIITLFRIKKSNQLKEHGVVTTAYVTEVWDAFRDKVGFQYYFFHNGQKVTSKDFYNSISFTIRDSLVGKAVPVIYLPNNPSANILLLTETVFRSYHKPYPDSLKWIQQYQN